MRIQSEKIDVLYELESSVFECFLIAVNEAIRNNFNIVECNVSIFQKEYLNIDALQLGDVAVGIYLRCA